MSRFSRDTTKQVAVPEKCFHRKLTGVVHEGVTIFVQDLIWIDVTSNIGMRTINLKDLQFISSEDGSLQGRFTGAHARRKGARLSESLEK